jgi:hypothetical protein
MRASRRRRARWTRVVDRSRVTSVRRAYRPHRHARPLPSTVDCDELAAPTRGSTYATLLDACPAREPV